MTRSDTALKEAIEAELRWDPKVNAARVGVTVEEGAVSLLGTVATYAQKRASEEATRRVSGVRTVAQDLTVRLVAEHQRTDPEIAVATHKTLKWNVLVPSTVTALVENAHVTLEGEVEWNFQREAAERAVRHLTGVTGVYNSITIHPRASTAKVKSSVRAALERQATTDGSSIHIETSGGKVTLSGHASSWQSIADASNAAWGTPGVTEVDDRIQIARNA